MTPELFHILGNTYVEKVEKASRGFNDIEADGSVEAAEQSLVILKIIRRLIISGYEHPNRVTDVQQFWSLTLSHFANFVAIAKQRQPSLSPRLVTLIGKHVLQLSKLHLAMATEHPAAFALLHQSIDMVKFYWSLVTELGTSYGSSNLSEWKIVTDGDADTEEKSILEKLGLKGLVLLRACARVAFHPVQTFKYLHPSDKEERASAVQMVKSQLFEEGFVVQVMELLVTKFFVFRPNDLREWEEEPEEWERREEEITDAWEFSIRSCAEKLFLDLITQFKDLLIPKLLNVFYSYAGKYSGNLEVPFLTPF